jgi:lysophospholipase L1-like esterase
MIGSSLGTQVFNQGVSGAGWNILAGHAATEIDQKLSRTNRVFCTEPFLILFAGTNDIFNEGKTGIETYELFQNYLTARISAGWKPDKIVVVTMLPRLQAGESERNAYNNRLISGAMTYGYKLARVDLDPNIGKPGSEANHKYYVDGVHPNEAGQRVLANIICKALNLPPAMVCPSYPTP